jgi:hypothetical protein
MPTDLQLAFRALNGKKPYYDKLINYYDGHQPLTYTAKRLEDIFKDLDAYFAENWCSVVVDSTLDRINLREIRVGSGRSSDPAWMGMWERSELFLESDQVHEFALVAGEAFVIAWPNDDGEPEAYVNDPRLCHIFYDGEDPRRKRFAAKWWVDRELRLRMTLYYPDRLEYYISTQKYSNVVTERGLQPYRELSDDPSGLYNISGKGATEKVVAANEYGEVPVFHFRTSKRLKSDLQSVVPIQNGINKLLTDMMVTAEFQAFPQRWVISNAETKGKLKNAPNEIMDLPAGDQMSQGTAVGQFEAANLDNYMKGINDLATAISSITRTPKHYFFSIGSNLSGEALIAMEAPLNKKAQDRIDRFAPVWKQLALCMLRMKGTVVDPNLVEVIFDRPETVQPRTTAEIRQMNRQAGIPLATILREEGKSKAEVERVLKEAKEEKLAGASLAQAYLDEARKNFDEGSTPGASTAPASAPGSSVLRNFDYGAT